MDSLAADFDMPLDSPEHRSLAEDGWMGGSHVTLRYWLGRLLKRNLFRESDESVVVALQEYLTKCGRSAGATLVADYQAWDAAAILVRHDFEAATCQPPQHNSPTNNPRLVAALDAVFTNPALTSAEVARLANTTAKQVNRMGDVNQIQRLWRFRQRS